MSIKANNLTVTNSLTGEKEPFVPLNAPHVGMYVCGPTVYSDVHLGNCRTFISFDLIYRYLSHLGYSVRYVRNITDAGHLENDADEGEDKIAKKARLEQLEPMEIVQRYTVGFRHIMGLFNALPPSIEPTATGHIVEQIEMTKRLLEKGLAYEVNGSVYFDVDAYNQDFNYGELSGRQVDELLSGTRELDGQSEKRNPRDFALWKKASPYHIMRWPSPWGVGFPGWHLECSVMSSKYLGEQFDIHGGGMDLKFPHHECEIAQCQADTGVRPVKYWLHGNMLTLNGKRMSKSTGNTILPLELFSGNNDLLDKGFSPSVVRFFMMQAHYRSVLDFSNDALLAAEKGYNRLMDALAQADKLQPGSNSTWSVENWEKAGYAAMDDDFNSPMLVAQLFEAVRFINTASQGAGSLTAPDLERFKATLHAFVYDILGLVATEVAEQNHNQLEAAMKLLLQLRDQARLDRNWALSDQIRDQLAEAGITVRDGKEGSSYSLNG